MAACLAGRRTGSVAGWLAGSLGLSHLLVLNLFLSLLCLPRFKQEKERKKSENSKYKPTDAESSIKAFTGIMRNFLKQYCEVATSPDELPAAYRMSCTMSPVMTASGREGQAGRVFDCHSLLPFKPFSQWRRLDTR